MYLTHTSLRSWRVLLLSDNSSKNRTDAVKLRKRSTQQRTQIRLWMHQFLSHTSYPELLKRLFTGNRCRKRKGNIFVEMFAVGRCFFKFFPEHLEPSIFPQVQNLWDTRWHERTFIGSDERDLNSYWLREKSILRYKIIVLSLFLCYLQPTITV